MSDEEFEKDIAEMVIRPKLQRVVRKYPNIKNKAELRKFFLEEEGISMSAAKFEEYLEILGITFLKRVEIAGLFPAAPARPQAGPDAPEEEEVVFDNEIDKNVPMSPRGNQNPRDMFGLA